MLHVYAQNSYAGVCIHVHMNTQKKYSGSCHKLETGAEINDESEKAGNSANIVNFQ